MKKVLLRSDFWFGPQTNVKLRAHHLGKSTNWNFTLDELTGTEHALKDRTVSGRRPVIGICVFGGDLNPCQAMSDILVQRTAAGIRSAGGIPFEFEAGPPLGEPLTRPSAMMMRNLTTLALIETVIANPLDGIVFMTGCDKTVPAALMTMMQTDIPSIITSVGPMLNGREGSGGHLWKNSERLAAGEIDEMELLRCSQAEQPSAGHCMSMGTASTMNAMAEALGLALPGSSAIPSPYAARSEFSFKAGAAAVDAVLSDRHPRGIATLRAYYNAIATVTAIGGSTNAVIHLTAAARMGGLELGLDDWERHGRDIPRLINVKPSGAHMMEDFQKAGGLPAVLRELEIGRHIDTSVLTCTGRTLKDELALRGNGDRKVIASVSAPFREKAGIAILRGNLAPDGAVLKVSAVKNQALLKHRGRAVVFDSMDDYVARIDDPSLDIQPDKVLILRNCGIIGYPGMPEVGNMRLPSYLLKQGVKEMVTISDARMSGTAYGLHILHVTPEAAVGGPLALVQTGDWIDLDVASGKLTLDVADDELVRRRERWTPPVIKIHSPWQILQSGGVHQADKGCTLKVFDDPRLNVAAQLYEPLPRQH